MKILSDNILTGFEGRKETRNTLGHVETNRTRLELLPQDFSSEHMVQTITLQQHINDVILLPVPRGLKTGKTTRRTF